MNIKQDGIAPNSGRLLWAGFMAILAAGIGFGVRGGLMLTWKGTFGFTDGQLGAIGGAGLVGFCFGIIIGGVVCDKIGYGKLIIAAFATHILSAVVTLSANPDMGQDLAYQMLYWGSFIFAYANGTLEAVANPLVATLFPTNRTHYLNILHASWPAGLVLGGAIGWMLGGADGWSWQAQLALYMLPVLIYGIMFFGQHMPKSEASQNDLTLGEMFKDVGVLGGLVICFLLSLFFSNAMGLGDGAGYGIAGILLLGIGLITNFSIGSWLLFVLFIAHALVGAVELGTDSWVQNITGNILTPEEGKILFIFASAIMFVLRFCADFIEKKLKLSPVGILLVCSVLALVGLNLVSGVTTFIGAMGALAIYAVGKTFFWPTMLAVASDRFPRTGAIAISIMGGIGMLAGGLVGSSGLGYAKDRFASEALEEANAAIYSEYQAEKPSKFLFFEEVIGLDGTKVGDANKALGVIRKELATAGITDAAAAMEKLPVEQKALIEASIDGDRKTLVADSAIPAAMAVIFLLLMLYFRSIGGYKALSMAKEE
ncbi:MAG: MFS transporter [Planctomycetes bacterium]|nr:MFS transporter [Planctomycetota bacterium]